jgi:hypothetical protein
MRVTTEFWVSSVLRRAFSAGGFGAVERRGAAEAGAVLILRRDRMGATALYAPAPQASYDEARPQERLFTQVLNGADEEAAAGRIARETRFDPDLWIVELEVDDALFEELVAVTTPSA